ncbi:dTDP-4-dehydrorhamnose 3,5-epimerase [Maricaulis sp.]|jgi:dTDP-4-dehydrorhamnose 3,5-epimerase|uniref:dTDP-4-dehydrorhamnose 3,5-epimerase n=1 Tax=Maricaulis sp. TaxID=1486257 RepID=UPI000C6AC52F|nr:dTDP-4-dehydrorhamnose 3,5-epimerase [Maricaulis sp.]MAC88814.1 dTDP-4-dehydrorhamnose 3,5-epimerase [Maricaulis sp.]
MEVVDLSLIGARFVTPRRYGDDRGFFSEVYNLRQFAENGIEHAFVQDNHSYSAAKGTVRGLHYQAPPFAQTKLVRVLAGSIYDVIVDVRKGSPNFGQHIGVHLDTTGSQLLVPKGFLHGFITLEPDTHVLYKVDAYYSAEADGCVKWDDPDLGIDWGPAAENATLSDKDRNASSYNNFQTPFVFEA